MFEEYDEDCTKLMEVLKTLQLQKEMILQEIKLLSMKGRPLPPISPLLSQQTESRIKISSSLSNEKIIVVRQPERDGTGEGSDEINDDAANHNKGTGTDGNEINNDDNDEDSEHNVLGNEHGDLENEDDLDNDDSSEGNSEQ